MASNFIRNKSIWIVVILILAFIIPYLPHCPSDTTPTTDNTTPAPPPTKPAVNVPVPAFSSDSAYFFVKKQVDF